MEGSEMGLLKSKKRKEPNMLQSEKQNVLDHSQTKRRQEPHVYLNEPIGHATEITSNNKKAVPETSLGRDKQLPSPSKGNLSVILALSAVQSEGKKKVQSKNLITNSPKNNNVVENMVEKKRAASKTTQEHEEVCAFQKKPKKKCSERRKKCVVENGSEKLSESLLTKYSDQPLVEKKSERFDGNIWIESLAAAEVNQSIDCDTLCTVKTKESKLLLENGNNKVPSTLVEEKLDEFDGKVPPLLRTAIANEVQNQEPPVNKSIEAAPKRADKFEEASTGLPDCRPPNLMMQDIKRKRQSDQEDKFDDSNQNLLAENLDLFDGEVSLPEIKRKRHSGRRKKHLLESRMIDLSSTLVNNHSNQNLMEETSGRFDEKFSVTPPIIVSEVYNKVDNSPICEEVENSDVQVSKGILLELPSETKQDVSLTQHKRKRKKKRHADQQNVDNRDVEVGKGLALESPRDKEKKHTDKKIKNKWESGCQHVSDTSNRKETEMEVPESTVGDLYSHTLEVMSEQGNPSGLCRNGHDTLSQNDRVLSVDESLTDQPNKSASSKKKRRKGVKMVATESTKDELHDPSASPERGQISQSLKKLLILDLNGLLVDILSVLPKGYRADKRIAKKALVKRPFCDDFVEFCFETFNVGVWSSRTRKNVDKVVDYIMGDYRHKLLFCWHQSHCTATGFSTLEDAHKPLVLKEIKKLWNQRVPGLPWEKGHYNESNTLLLDDSPYKALLNPPHTAIFPVSYGCRNANDNALGPGGKIRTYLEGVARAEHVQKYVEQNPFGQRAVTNRNPSWGYYLRLIKANNFCIP